MGAARQYEVEGVVVAQVLVGEKDKIITLLTREQGKVRAVARGAVRPGSSLGPCVELLTHGRYYCVRRRSIDLISQAVPLNSFPSLKGDLWRMSCGLYMAELVDSSTAEGVAQPTLYDLMIAMLREFDTAGYRESLLRYFEIRMLDHLGFRPSLQYCLECGTRLKPVDNALSATLGGTVCQGCAGHVPDARTLSVDALKVLRLWLDSSFDVAARVTVSETLSAELDEHLNRLVVGVLQREVKSRGWLRRLKQETLLTSSTGVSTIASRLEPR